MIRPQPKPVKRIKPRKPLRRSRMQHKRPRRVDRETELEKRYKAWVHTVDCAGKPYKRINHDGPPGNEMYVAMENPGVGAHRCIGRIEQAHYRDVTGFGLKTSNLESLPLCKSLHDSYDGRTRGFFYGWPKEEKKRWFMARLIETHARYELETGEPLIPGVE